MTNEIKHCRYCDEEISVNAKLCKHCGKHTAIFRVGFRGRMILLIVLGLTVFTIRGNEEKYDSTTGIGDKNLIAVCTYAQIEVTKIVNSSYDVEHPICTEGKIMKMAGNSYGFESYVKVRDSLGKFKKQTYRCMVGDPLNQSYTIKCNILN